MLCALLDFVFRLAADAIKPLIIGIVTTELCGEAAMAVFDELNGDVAENEENALDDQGMAEAAGDGGAAGDMADVAADIDQ